MQLPIPSEKGAIEEIIWKVSLELTEIGFKVEIFNPITKNILAKVVKSLAIGKTLSYENTLLHFHDLISCFSYCTTAFRSKKTILSLHYPPWKTKTKGRYRLIILTLKSLKDKGTVFTVPSRAMVSWIEKFIGGSCFLLPNGVDTSLFNPLKRRADIRDRLLNNRDVLIPYVARIHPDKNQIDLLRAVKILVDEKRLRNFKVLFIGPLRGSFTEGKKKVNEYYIYLRHYTVRNKLNNYVDFLGEVDRKEEVAYILASSDIYVHVSLTEAAAPLAIMEALASGLPVVAYDLPFYDFLKDNENAILVKRGDVRALATVLETLINDKNLRENLERRARIFAEENLSWKKIVERYYVELYKRLLQ
jgi:glycosyltransferase involved in cell wall biosynthesis